MALFSPPRGTTCDDPAPSHLAGNRGLLAERGIGAVIVTGGDGEVLGILSERDIVRAIGRNGVGVMQDAVSKHMTTKVVTASMEDAIDDVMERMTTGASAISGHRTTVASSASCRSATWSSTVGLSDPNIAPCANISPPPES